MATVWAINTTTKRKQRVPDFWVGAKDKDGNPRKFGGFAYSQTPRQKSRAKAAEAAQTPAAGDDTKKEK